jgi:hypothetical protein
MMKMMRKIFLLLGRYIFGFDCHHVHHPCRLQHYLCDTCVHLSAPFQFHLMSLNLEMLGGCAKAIV